MSSHENTTMESAHPIARIHQVSLHYGKTVALDAIDLDVPEGSMVGLIGPDGVGKSSLLSLVAGARTIQSGKIEIFGGDLNDRHHRQKICPRIAYMPQGIGKNLYQTLSVLENLNFFACLFGQDRVERKRRIDELLHATGLFPFADRSVSKLSGGMKQKLALSCALIHDPDFLILDEPTTGIDPLARRIFWELIARIRSHHSGMSLLIATAYMEEAAHFDKLVAMNAGRTLATGSPQDILAQTGSKTMEEAFIALLPSSQRESYKPVHIIPREKVTHSEIAIEAHDLTKRFGHFTAVDQVNFSIEQGEIFGFLGSNGCGKTTTMKMLTGLLPASEGGASLFGRPLNPHDIDTRRRVGYMSQSFSLYTELTVEQNLVLHARLFRIPEEKIPDRVNEMGRRFGLAKVMESLPNALPLGLRQRLSLAVAMIHGPEILILDEPTSGVDPLARDAFWQIMIDLARNDKVTIFISTHFMNEAERCDRISLMNAGRVLASDSPQKLMEERKTETLEEAFISYLKEATADTDISDVSDSSASLFSKEATPRPSPSKKRNGFSFRRMASYFTREALELLRDPIRLALSALGSLFLMVALGYGINLDVENLNFAVLDRDQTITSRNYVLNLAGSRYFTERPPIKDYADLDWRMRANEISLAIEIPPGFARDLRRGKPVSIGAWVDGAMPSRAEIVLGYVGGMHALWLGSTASQLFGADKIAGPVNIESRFRYNPDIKSMPAMVPAVIPILLLLIPAILSALSVVREKELGSIINFYVTPTTRFEFLFGKQIPYILVAMVNFLILVGLAVTLFDVPVKGSFPTLALASLLYVTAATSFGLVISAFTSSQIAALFGTTILTLLPALQFSGIFNPVSSLEGIGALIGSIYPTAYFLTITSGTFSKGLGFHDLENQFIPLFLAIPVLMSLGILFLKKQER